MNYFFYEIFEIALRITFAALLSMNGKLKLSKVSSLVLLLHQ